MNNNQKLLANVGGVLVAFIIAALFQYVFHWGVTAAIVVAAIVNLVCLAGVQSVDRYMPIPGRIFLLVIALVIGFVFGLMFMTWTLLAIYLVAITAASVFAIARA